MAYKFSEENKGKIVSFLREYIELCLKHKIIILGIIGAETAIWNMTKHEEIHYPVKNELRGNIQQIISNLYDDSGNLEINEEDITYIHNAVKDLLREK